MAKRRSVKHQEKPKKRRDKGNYILYYLIFSIIFIAISVTLSFTHFFKIESVQVSGNNKYLEEHLIASTGIVLGSSIFDLDRDGIAQTLKNEYVYIEDVQVKIQFPPSIVLDISQAKPIASIKNGERYVLMSGDGTILEEVDKDRASSLPIIMGLGEPTEEWGLEFSSNMEEILVEEDEEASSLLVLNTADKIPPSEQERIDMVTALYDAIDNTGFGRIDIIDTSNILNLIVVYDNRLIIQLGAAADLDYKLKFIMETAEYNNTNFSGIIDSTISKQLRVRKADVATIIDESYSIAQVEVETVT